MLWQDEILIEKLTLTHLFAYKDWLKYLSLGWNFVDKGQLGVNFCSKISSRWFFDLSYTDFQKCFSKIVLSKSWSYISKNVNNNNKKTRSSKR